MSRRRRRRDGSIQRFGDSGRKGKAIFNMGESDVFMSEDIELGAIHIEPAFLYR